MVDVRENILARIAVVLETVPGVVTVKRNRSDITNEKRPVVVLLDGDEAVRDLVIGRRKPPNSPQFVEMTPEIHLAIDRIKPEADDAGSRVNAFRIAIIEAIVFDQLLRGLCKTDGGGAITYQAAATDFGRGRANEGEITLSWSFVYPLVPSQL